MPRLTQPYVSDTRRPRHGESGHLRPRAKRLPITFLWDEMASAAPVEVDEPFVPQPESAGSWDGRPAVDDDDDVPDVVIRHVSAMSGAAGSRRDEGSGMHVVDLGGDLRTAAEWPRAAAPARPRSSLRGVAVGVGLLLVAVTWRLAQPSHAVAQADERSPTSVVAPTIDPPVAAAPAADIVEPAPVAVVEPAPEPAMVAVITPEVAPEIPADEAPDDAAAAGVAPELDFNYRSARRYLDEQASFLRKACMAKGKDVQRLRIHVKARPNGRAAIAVPGVGPEVAGCVRKALNFPFDRSPHGGAFLYSLGATSSRLEQRPL